MFEEFTSGQRIYEKMAHSLGPKHPMFISHWENLSSEVKNGYELVANEEPKLIPDLVELKERYMERMIFMASQSPSS